MTDILDDLITVARTEEGTYRGSRWIGDIAMRAHGEIERLRAIAETTDIMTAQAIKRQADEIERLNAARILDAQRMVKMSDEFERLTAAHDDYMVRANANVCELNREIERLRAKNKELASTLSTRLLDKTKDDEIDRLLAENGRLFREIAVQANYLTAEIERLKNTIKNCPPVSESEYVRRLEAEIERLRKERRPDGKLVDFYRSARNRKKTDD